MAESRALQGLDRLIGRFLRRDAIVYRGTVAAESVDAADNSTFPHTVTTRLVAGPALAMLATVGDGPGEATFLQIHSLGANRYAFFEQRSSQPETTWGRPFGDGDPEDALRFDMSDRSCTSCAPTFASHPEAIDFAPIDTKGVAATSQAGGMVDVPIETKVTAKLEAAPPCTLTWEELARLVPQVEPGNVFYPSLDAASFQVEGDELVAHRLNYYDGPTGEPCTYGNHPYSSERVEYAIDLWIKRANLARSGVRNYREISRRLVCGP